MRARDVGEECMFSVANELNGRNDLGALRRMLAKRRVCVPRP